MRLAIFSPPVYGWFTEGFDTLDLKQAKALPCRRDREPKEPITAFAETRSGASELRLCRGMRGVGGAP
jgi:hypothetical protein